MIPRDRYFDNLALLEQIRDTPGDVVECGVWRGGMIAGMAKMLGNSRAYVLLDSFEGLPPAGPHDGSAAVRWQSDRTADNFHDNCSAEIAWATEAMNKSGAHDVRLIRGWFDDTVPRFATESPSLCVLRIDGDWYESTLTCLRNLYPFVIPGGLIIIDDYGAWEGCTKATHQYLAEEDRPEPIRHTRSGVAYLRKAT